MRMRLVFVGLLLGLGGFGGCGGDDGDEQKLSINADVNNVCDEIAEVACHNMYQCCSEGEIEDMLGVSDPRTEQECREDVRRGCDRSIASRELGLAQGRLRFDPQIMNKCLEALIAPEDTCATIASTLPWRDACEEAAWVGLVQNGGKCLSTSECASKDSFCGPGETCVALPIDGEPCGTRGCATGAFCDLGTCSAQLKEGDGCTANGECLEGLFCDPTTVLPVCARLHAVGEMCTSAASCESARCNPGTCAGSTNTCFTDNDCTGRCADDSSFCTADSNCSSSGTCSMTASVCFGSFDCTGAGNECVFPVACVRECVGDVVCADTHVVADYCQGAIDDLPVVVDQRARPQPTR